MIFYWNHNLPVISTLLWYRNQELSIPSKERIDCCQNELVGLKRRPTFPYIPLFGQLPRLEAHHSVARSRVECRQHDYARLPAFVCCSKTVLLFARVLAGGVRMQTADYRGHGLG